MKSLRQLWRIIRINQVLIRHRLDELVLSVPLFRPIRFTWYLLPWNWVAKRDHAPLEQRIRHALEDLGPIFVKFGQMLSTRRDLLPLEIADELANLQDRVPPFPGDLARLEIERVLGKPVAELFASFDEQALASASIAQVHAAELHDGSSVVVKVLRPGVEKRIAEDIEVLRLIAALAERYWPDGRRLRPLEVVMEFEKTLLDELDLMREAANAAHLKRHWESSPLLCVPEIHWPLTRRRVMVMERVSGIRVSDIDALRAAGVDMKRLAEDGVEIFFTQVFTHNFFHADMHPGNIFVDASDPMRPRWLAIDFGIVGTLSPADQHYLAENFLAFFNRDYQRVAELHVESGWAPPGTRVDEFESAIRTVCEPIFHRPLKDISFGLLLIRLFQTARRFDMEIQPQLVLLQKTLLNIEGLGREIYPDLDLWATAKPYLESWTREQLGPQALYRHWRDHLPETTKALIDLPRLAARALEEMSEQRALMDSRSAQFDRWNEELATGSRRRAVAIAGAGLVIASALLLTGGWMTLGWVMGGVGLVALVYAALR
ncbi:MAG: ubiquinone biosynthesis regulatory protein kinase UbiB [Xanthomonadaceae bacterium]|nr:ubiquinone biosynthesis regulatory protein kinase UbiB [Xanthomonadaceae bacterium]